MFFSFAKLIIFSAIKEDCVGEPPGELIIKATAGDFLSANNLSISFSIPVIVYPDLAIPACPITPDNLNVGILISFEKNFLNTRLNSKSYSLLKDQMCSIN